MWDVIIHPCPNYSPMDQIEIHAGVWKFFGHAWEGLMGVFYYMTNSKVHASSNHGISLIEIINNKSELVQVMAW